MERRSASLVTTHSELVDTVLTPRAAANFRSILTSRSSKTILDFAQLRAPSGRGLKFVVLRSLWVSERSSDLATPWMPGGVVWIVEVSTNPEAQMGRLIVFESPTQSLLLMS